jgi:hypothetical protein
MRNTKKKASVNGNLIYQADRGWAFSAWTQEKNFLLVFIHDLDLFKGQKQQSTWEMESHDSKNGIKWRRNFLFVSTFMNFFLALAFYNWDDDGYLPIFMAESELEEKRNNEISLMASWSLKFLIFGVGNGLNGILHETSNKIGRDWGLFWMKARSNWKIVDGKQI